MEILTHGFCLAFFCIRPDDVVADLYAFVADENGRAGNQLSDLGLALVAERATQDRLIRRRSSSLAENRHNANERCPVTNDICLWSLDISHLSFALLPLLVRSIR